MVCAEQQCTNHAKPSLRSGSDLKVKQMLGRCAKGAPDHRLVYASAIRGAGLIEKNTKIWYKGIFKGATCDQATSIQ